MPDTQKAPRTREPARLSAPMDPGRFVEVTGERMALLGREAGPFECWAWPLKLVSDLRFRLLRAGAPFELPRRELTVLPGELLYVWSGGDIQLRTEVFACRERAGLAFGFALDSDEPLEIEVAFRCDFRPMWPAGLGGQVARRDRVTGAFALSEELGRYAALIGASEAAVECLAAEHALPEGEVRIRIPMLAGGSSSVLAIAAARVEHDPLAPAPALERSGESGRIERAIAATRELWWRLVSDFSAEREAVRAHWRTNQAEVLALETPFPALDEAFRWAGIAIERAWTRVDGLGRGLVAGLGESGAGQRPGLGWFLDGDALAAARALTTAGDLGAAREVLRFAASHQRADGRLMRELTLSAELCDWLEDYPYAYADDTVTADFVSALDLYLRFSGDLELARELMPVARRAIEVGARALDGDGRWKGSTPVLSAGSGRDGVESEAFRQGAWVAALGGAARLAQALGEDSTSYRALEERARAAFEAFWCESRGHYGHALLEGGSLWDGLSAGLGYPLSRGLGERARAWASVQALNGPALMSDWGIRAHAAGPDSDPVRAAVSPYLTNFASLAFFAHGHAFAGHQVLFGQVGLTHLGGLGFLAGALDGAQAVLPGRGVPHRIASSAALIESTLLGLFGFEAAAAEARVAFRPTLPPHWDEARLQNLRVGETRLDLRFYRRRGAGATVVGLELERGEGPPLQIGFAPVLPPLSKLLDGPGWLRPSGAVVPRRLHRSVGEPLTLEARVLEGPALLLPAGRIEPGAPSLGVRLVGQRLENGALRWSFAGPAGSRAVLPFFCDFEVAVEGARLADGELRLEFPSGTAGAWSTVDVGVRAR